MTASQAAGSVVLRFLVFVALAGGSIASLFADDEPVRAPYVERGDCWTYRAENMQHQSKPIRDYELCVTLVDKSKGTIFAVAKVKEDEREFDTVYSSEWAAFASISGRVSTQGASIYKYPLKVGDAYSTDYDFRDARLGPNAGRTKWDMNVVGWEDVTVPAGTFRALRIEGHGKVWRSDRLYDFEHSMVVWYSPKINRHIKYRYQNPDRSVGEELTGYRLNQ